MGGGGGGGELLGLGSKPEKVFNTFEITTTFPLSSVKVMLVSYCCLFSVLSNEMLNVSIGIFS